MKLATSSFIIMIVLAIVLVGIIATAQYFTARSTYALNEGNNKALRTYKINNNIQQLVSLSLYLESEFSKANNDIPIQRKKNLADSVLMLGHNNIILIRAIGELSQMLNTQMLDKAVTNQVNLYLEILNATQAATRNRLADSLQKIRLGNYVFASSLGIRQTLEDSLQRTLDGNTKESKKFSLYNHTLAVLAIIGILSIFLIVIYRRIKRVRLINQLQATQEDALRNKKAKEDFLANMSHELRTPLNALIGFGDLLSQTHLDERQQEYMSIIKSSGYNLLNLVNDILDLSKIEAGMLKIITVPFSLQDLMKDVEKMFSGLIEDKQLTFDWSCDEAIPEMMQGDPGRLRQVLINLINNAIKFTTTGGVKVVVGIIWTDEVTRKFKLSFSVKDTGVGIPSTKINTIFERYEQLEQGNIRQYAGTGLGLSIVKSIVEKLGGVVSVYSEEGKGSEFNFTCIFEKITEEQAALSASQQNVVTKINFEKTRLLLVEDNKANQKLLQYMLTKYQANIALADNGLMAIEMLETTTYDVVLMDIQMPYMDGYAAIQEIRNRMNLHVPVIAMTAHVAESEIEKCFKAGFTDYLAKPLKEALLVDKIAKYTLHKTSDMQTPPAEDTALAYFRELMGSDTAIMKEILLEVQKQWTADKAEIAAAVADNNVGSIKRILHRIKSTFSPFGPEHPIYQYVQESEAAIIINEKEADTLQSENFIKVIDEILRHTLTTL